MTTSRAWRRRWRKRGAEYATAVRLARARAVVAAAVPADLAFGPVPVTAQRALTLYVANCVLDVPRDRCRAIVPFPLMDQIIEAVEDGREDGAFDAWCEAVEAVA